jgi:DNA repair exonuclease SbcCD ATPase subunit
MISGPQALQSLHDALAEIRAEERAITERMARATDKIAKLRATEAEHFASLAEIRLGPEAQADMKGRLNTAEAEARELIAQHAAEIETAQDELGTIEARLAELSDKRAEALQKLEDAHKSLDGLSDKVADRLEKDEAFVARREAVQHGFEIADRANEKAEQAEADREEKGKPYREDPLFMYLWERGFGTRNYKATNLIRFFDGKVARLVRYDDARANFAMLNDIPLRLREHADRLMEEAEDAGEALEAEEIAAVDAAGGKPAREAVEAAQAEIDAIDAEVVELEDDRDEQARRLRKLAQGSDPAFKDAASLLAKSLMREDVDVLLADARATDTGADDSLVGMIDSLRATLVEDETEVREDKERLKVLASRRRELEDIEWEFKKARFDDPRSSFSKDDLVGDMLGEFLRGAITASSYWGQWRDAQKWRSGTSRPGGRIGLPRDNFRHSKWRGGDPFSSVLKGALGGGSSSSSGGGFSRPRSGNKGSRRHGGFKTGGGF